MSTQSEAILEENLLKQLSSLRHEKPQLVIKQFKKGLLQQMFV